MIKKSLSLIVLCLVVGPQVALAGSNDQAKIAAHLQVPITGKGAPPVCEQAELPPCNPVESHLSVQGDIGTGYYLYLLVLDGDAEAGVAGASFGISYGETLLVRSWVLCADLEFDGGPEGSPWPSSGSGNVITWNSDSRCQNSPAVGDSSGGVTAVLGAFYVYAYAEDNFYVTKRLYAPTPDLDVADCSAVSSHLSFPNAAGMVAFGGLTGFDPCTEEESLPPPPGGPSDAPGLFSSGYDPTAPVINWPHSFVLGSNKAVVAGNHLFHEGDEVVFHYDQQAQALYVNGYLWRSYANHTQQSEPTTPHEFWVEELRRRYSIETSGTPQDRMQRALASMDKDILNPDFEPLVESDQVTVRFKGDPTLDWVIVFKSHQPTGDAEDRASAAVSELHKAMMGSHPYVVINYPGRFYLRSGDAALTLLSVLNRAEAGTLTQEDLSIARTFGKGVLEAVQGLAGGKVK
jgi:hypothetical protein